MSRTAEVEKAGTLHPLTDSPLGMPDAKLDTPPEPVLALPYDFGFVCSLPQVSHFSGEHLEIAFHNPTSTSVSLTLTLDRSLIRSSISKPTRGNKRGH